MSMNKFDIQCKDIVKGTFEATLEQVPVVNFFYSAFSKIKGGSLQRRYESWQEMVGERLSALESTVFDTLGNNETFATALLKTTELAVKSNAKKMELLANAVKYAAENKIEDDYIIIYLNYIDGYAISHLRLLRFFDDPNQYYSRGVDYITTSPMTLYHETFSVPQSEYRLLDTMVKQLFDDGLLNTREMNAGMTMRGALSQRTTDIGRKFIEFFGLKDVDL